MREYGGYIEQETYHAPLLHEKAIALNCGRNALAYLCRAKDIQKLFLPRFLCSSVYELCDRIGVRYDCYSVDERFEPVFNQKMGEKEWLYIVNFYGQLDNKTLESWKDRHSRVIVDNAQSYFQAPVEGVDTLYTCRKFFGVADGAFLYTDARLPEELPLDESFERMHFLLGRYEHGANEFYSEYVANNRRFATEPIKRMSRLTQNLLRGIDYERIARQRQKNHEYLHEKLCRINRLNPRSVYGAFAYPLMIENGSAIRKELQKKKIYIPTLWPNVLENCSPDSLEYRYAADILPIPVDQRYCIEDMKYLANTIERL